MIALLVFFLAVLTTAVYGVVAWYLSALWSAQVTDPVLISRFAAYSIKPLVRGSEYAMVHWQGLALISLLLNAIWGYQKLRETREAVQLCLPFCCHLCWLVFAFFAHVAGGLISVIGVAYVLG